MPLSWGSVLLGYVDETSSWLPSVPATHGSIRSCNGLAVLLVMTVNITLEAVESKAGFPALKIVKVRLRT